VAQAFLSYALGSPVRETGARRALRDQDPASWSGRLDPAVYPSLASVAADGLDFDPEGEFEFGLELLIRGLRMPYG
jgi:hypothetical protein